jgi:hypothetical protein
VTNERRPTLTSDSSTCLTNAHIKLDCSQKTIRSTSSGSDTHFVSTHAIPEALPERTNQLASPSHVWAVDDTRVSTKGS